MPEIKNIGFIGLGIMGKPMAKNLLKAGFHLKVHDLVRRRSMKSSRRERKPPTHRRSAQKTSMS